jgi:capsular polysaccharide biosynthesis protein/MinD-like ATPase involved in chromosome partitioning or flagellar assembly
MLQLRHYTRVMRRWLWLLLLGIIICSSFTFGISTFVLKPTYQSTALLEVNGPLLSTTTTSSGSDVFSNQALAISDALLITSTDVLQGVAQKLPGVNVHQLSSSVSASPQASSQIIEVRAQANTPTLAATIANTVVAVFMQQQEARVTVPLDSQKAQVSSELATTNAALALAQAQLKSLQASSAPIDAITRQNSTIASYKASYTSLITNQLQLQTQENQAQGALSIAQTALPPSQASSPHVALNTGIAAVMGFLLMVMFVLLLDWLDTSIQTAEDVSTLAQLEALGSLPSSEHPLLPVTSIDTSEVADEAIEQTFMTAVLSGGSNLLRNETSSVMVTALRTEAGSTTVAINLALVLAQSGRRVLLVDANLHHPSLQTIFHASTTYGLTEMLADIHHLDDEMIASWLESWRTDITNLWLLPAGVTAIHQQIPMIQQVQKLRIFTNTLLAKEQSTQADASAAAIDCIIFDTSALSQGADAVTMASVTDYSVLVVDAGKERSDLVRQAGATLQRLGSRVLGVLVNRQTARHRPYFYAGGDHQGLWTADTSLEKRIEELLKKETSSSGNAQSQRETKRPAVLSEQSLPEGVHPASSIVHKERSTEQLETEDLVGSELHNHNHNHNHTHENA